MLAVLERLGIRGYGTDRAREHSLGLSPLTVPIGHEWANDAEHVSSVSVDVRRRSRRGAPDREHAGVSALAAGIVTEDRAAADAFFASYRGTTAFWHAPTRFTDGFALTGAPETGINVEPAPGPRGPVTYRDLWLRQLRVVGDGTPACARWLVGNWGGVGGVVTEQDGVIDGGAHGGCGPPASACRPRRVGLSSGAAGIVDQPSISRAAAGRRQVRSEPSSSAPAEG